MEFFYDEQAVANDEEDAQQLHDEKTVQAFNKLEDEVNQGYEKTTSVLKSIVQEEEGGVKINLPLDPEVSVKAQQYLQRLDANLHNVESLAQNCWTQVSKPSFWSSMTEKLGDGLDHIVKLGNGEETVENKGVGEKSEPNAVGGNRTESELRALSTNRNLYLKFEGETDESIDVDAKTNEIAKLMEQDKNLAELMNEIVPQDISYKKFWIIFFTERQKILDMEDKRKKILEASNVDGEEEIGWDDVEDDAEEEEEPPVIVQNEDACSDEKLLEKDEGTTMKATVEKDVQQEEQEAQENDDDDDDWE